MSENEKKFLHFSIPKELKEEWSNFAKKLGRPLTKVIREAMNQLMYKESNKEQMSEIQKLKEELLLRIDERNKKIESLVSQANLKSKSNTTKITELENRIISYLKDVKEAKTNKIAYVMGEEELFTQHTMVDMKNKDKLYYNVIKNVWGIQ